ncbi:MAG TPA: STT3 domain-containing protein [Thermoanaerobaculia bacterium]
MNIKSPESSERWRTLAIASAIFAVAFLVRISNLQMAFHGGVPQLEPFDEMYHAKRIVYSATHLFRVLNYDPNRGPRGSFCPWPPLYDMLAGAASRLLGGRAPTEIVARASWFPPFASSLSCAFVAAWLCRRLGAATGLLGGFAVALSTPFFDRSRLGAIDHHFLEFPLVLGIVAATFAVTRATDTRETLRHGALLGLALTISLLIQPALLLVGGIVLISVLLLDPRKSAARASAAFGFALSAVLIFLYRAFQPSGYPDDEWYLGVPHAAALAGAAAACAVELRMLESQVKLARAAALAALSGLLVVAAVPNAFVSILAGSQFLGGDPWLKSIQEFQPLFVAPDSIWWADLLELGGGALLTLLMIGSWRRRSGLRVLYLLFALGYVLAAVTSRRFLAVAAPLCAVSGAVAVSDIRRDYGPWLARASVAVLILPALLQTGAPVLRPRSPITQEMTPMLRTAEFLGRQTSAPGKVLGPWSWGHLFNVVGGRGVLLDNFGTMGGRTDFENGAGIILATRESEVADYCAAQGVRFVVLQDPLPYLAAHAEMSGFPKSAFETPSPRLGSATRLTRSTFWWRSYFEGGRERPGTGPAGAAFREFRMVRVESEPKPSGVRSAVQIWQFAPLQSLTPSK